MAESCGYSQAIILYDVVQSHLKSVPNPILTINPAQNSTNINMAQKFPESG